MKKNEGIKTPIHLLSTFAWIALVLGVALGTTIGTISFLPQAPVIGIAVFAVLQLSAVLVAALSRDPAASGSLIWFGTGNKYTGKLYPLDSWYFGIGGWLFVLVAVLIFVSPVVQLQQTLMVLTLVPAVRPDLQPMPAWTAYTAFLWIFTALSAIFSIIAGLQLWKSHNPASVKLAVLSLWLCGPVRVFLIVLLGMWAPGAKFERLFSLDTLQYLAGDAIMPVFWTLYLKFSKRVRDTYFRSYVLEDYQRRAGAVEGDTPAMAGNEADLRNRTA